MQSIRALITAVLLSSALCGCASLYSASDSRASRDGLVYRLPVKLVKITTTVDKDGVIDVVSEASAAIPDMSTRYVATFSKNLAGKNDLQIGIAANGLLTSSTSTTTSQVSDILKSVAQFAGNIARSADLPDPALQRPVDCPVKSTFVEHFPIQQSSIVQAKCGVTVQITDLNDKWLPAGSERATLSSGARVTDVSEGAGVYYRQTMPIRVTVSHAVNANAPAAKQSKSAILLVPNPHAVEFLPIERTLFANNSATITFDDGIPKSFAQNADSELLAIAKLPGDVVASYFTGVGAAFTNRKALLTNEIDLLKTLDSLSAQRVKTALCQKAIVDNVAADIKTYCTPN